MPNVFSVTIFFIVFRETLEAMIIISVLLGIVEQIANTRLDRDSPPVTEAEKEKQNIEGGVHESPSSIPSNETLDDEGERKQLLRKLRIQVCERALLLFRVQPLEFSYQTSPGHSHSHRRCLVDFHWFWSGSVDRSGDRCGVHCCLVH